MKTSIKAALVAAAALGGVSFAATSASAAVVCNAANECWHVRGHYRYRPEWNVVVHPNNWRWADTDHYRWREHRGRGYWRDGVWVRF